MPWPADAELPSLVRDHDAGNAQILPAQGAVASDRRGRPPRAGGPDGRGGRRRSGAEVMFGMRWAEDALPAAAVLLCPTVARRTRSSFSGQISRSPCATETATRKKAAQSACDALYRSPLA